MSALPYPTYGVSNLYLFPVYQTREAFREATGIEAPAYDSTKAVKSWFDPNAGANPRRKLIYENVIAYADNGMPLADADGKPILEPLLIDREVAAVVNIPIKGAGKLEERETYGMEIPPPLRPLAEGEELFFQFGGSVAVKNVVLFDDREEGFKASDRALLRAIATKLGI